MAVWRTFLLALAFATTLANAVSSCDQKYDVQGFEDPKLGADKAEPATNVKGWKAGISPPILWNGKYKDDFEAIEGKQALFFADGNEISVDVPVDGEMALAVKVQYRGASGGGMVQIVVNETIRGAFEDLDGTKWLSAVHFQEVPAGAKTVTLTFMGSTDAEKGGLAIDDVQIGKVKDMVVVNKIPNVGTGDYIGVNFHVTIRVPRLVSAQALTAVKASDKNVDCVKDSFKVIKAPAGAEISGGEKCNGAGASYPKFKPVCGEEYIFQYAMLASGAGSYTLSPTIQLQLEGEEEDGPRPVEGFAQTFTVTKDALPDPKPEELVVNGDFERPRLINLGEVGVDQFQFSAWKSASKTVTIRNGNYTDVEAAQGVQFGRVAEGQSIYQNFDVPKGAKILHWSLLHRAEMKSAKFVVSIGPKDKMVYQYPNESGDGAWTEYRGIYTVENGDQRHRFDILSDGNVSLVDFVRLSLKEVPTVPPASSTRPTPTGTPTPGSETTPESETETTSTTSSTVTFRTAKLLLGASLLGFLVAL